MDIYDAILENDAKMVQTMIDQDPSVLHLRDLRDWTPLHFACCYGRTGIAHLWINAGADIHAKDQYDRTPLHYACDCAHADVAKLLIDAGADVHAKDNNDWTPLHTACYCGRNEVVQLLMIHGVDWLMLSKECHTPVDFAIELESDNTLVFLESAIDQLPDTEKRKIRAWRFRQELTKTS